MINKATFEEARLLQGKIDSNTATKEDKARFATVVNSMVLSQQKTQEAEKAKRLETFRSNQAAKWMQVRTEAPERDVRNLQMFQAYCATGKPDYAITTRLHSEGLPSQGGSFVPDDFQSEVSKALPAFSSIRPMVTVKNAKSNPYVVPRILPSGSIYDSSYQASAWVAEGAGLGDTGALPVVSATDPQTGLLTIYLRTYLGQFVVLTRELTQDSLPDFERTLAELFASKLGLDLDAAYLNGDGILVPRGIMTYAGVEIASITIGASPNITALSLIDLYTALPGQYRSNASWVMNSTTYGKILKAAGSTNDHPFSAFGENRGELWGRPIVISEFMPNVGTNAFPVLFGDFRCYRGVDRQDMEVIRLVERFVPNIGLAPYGRFGGDVEVFDAFRVGKTT